MNYADMIKTAHKNALVFPLMPPAVVLGDENVL